MNFMYWNCEWRNKCKKRSSQDATYAVAKRTKKIQSSWDRNPDLSDYCAASFPGLFRLREKAFGTRLQRFASQLGAFHSIGS